MNDSIQDIEVLNELLSIEFARCKRYDSPLSIAILQAKAPGLFEKLSETIRESDYFQYLGNDLYGIIYTHTDIDGAEIAIERVFSLCDSLCKDDFFIGLVEIEEMDECPEETTNRLSYALHEAINCKKRISVQKIRKEPNFLKKLKFMKWWR